MTDRIPRVVCIGVPTLDAIALVDRLPGSDELVPALDAQLAGGGVAATAAVTLARLGVSVALVGRVGDDFVGRRIRDDLVAEGVDVGGLRLGPGRSPLSIGLVERETGARSLAPFPGALDPIELSSEDVERCRGAAWVHVGESGYPTLRELRRAGVATPVSVDAGNPIRGLDLGQVTLYAPTERALLARFAGLDLIEAIRAALEEGPRLVVVTRGETGALAGERDPDLGIRVHDVPAPAIAWRIVSTLGAGDVFHGALLAALVRGAATPDALREANLAAALSCRVLDGRSAIPSRAELDAVLAAEVLA